CWDLGEERHKRTQHTLVYQLWLIRPEIQSPKAIADALRACRDNNLRELDSLIAAEPEFNPDFCQFYLRECLRYQYGPQEKEGLSTFRQLCRSEERRVGKEGNSLWVREQYKLKQACLTTSLD